MDARTSSPTWVDVDADGRYLDAAPEALAVFGVTLDDLRRHRVGDFAPAGMSAIHLALFRWIARQGRDFGGGSGTIDAPDGRRSRIRCSSIERLDDRFRMHFVVESGRSVMPRPDGVARVLEAWREAERDSGATGDEDPAYDVARDAARWLCEIYHHVVREKSAALPSDGDA